MNKGSVAICFVQQAMQGVLARQLDAAALLRAAGIAPDLLALPHARVSATSYSALWREVAQALDDEFFGQDARRMKVGSFAMLCHSVIHCKTLEQALQRALQFFDLLLDDLAARLEVEQGIAVLSLHPRGAGEAPRIFAHETMLIMLHGLACWLVGRRIPVLSTSFAYPEPAYSEEYRTMYSSRLRFDQASTSMRFDAAYLALPLAQDERTLTDFLRLAPANLVLKYKNSHSIASRIRRRLRALPVAHWPEFDALAGRAAPGRLDAAPAAGAGRAGVSIDQGPVAARPGGRFLAALGKKRGADRARTRLCRTERVLSRLQEMDRRPAGAIPQTSGRGRAGVAA